MSSNDTSAASSVAAGEATNSATSGPAGQDDTKPSYRPISRDINPPSHQQQHQPHPPPPHPHHPRAPLYHAYPPPPPSGHFGAGPYSAAMGKPPGNAYHPLHPPPPSRPQQPPPALGQPTQSTATVVPGSHLSSPRHSYDREDHNFHRPMPVRAHPSEAEYRGHPPPPPPQPAGSYSAAHYGSLPDDRRWMGPEAASAHQAHSYQSYDGQLYSKPHPTQSFPPPPPPPVGPGHMAYRYPHHVYPGSRLNDKSRMRGHQQSNSEFGDVDGREGATSPSQIELSHREEVENLGCTCKKTRCLKLYCQCFAVKIYCGPNCRCLLCFNTTKHEESRKEAMRSILTRNPTAFDTKFSKTKGERKAKEQQSLLAHKLGCKCRKSACMKKYCECYAGSVKCSPNCRCIGCKNTNSANFGPGKPDSNLPTREGGDVVNYDLPPPHGTRTGREPWMMNAAQNLAFLKHGSPSVEKNNAQHTALVQMHEAGEVASMPSLAASSSDTSPEEKAEDTARIAPTGSSRSSGPVNSLLIAAMAMTEFQSRKTSENAPPKNISSRPVEKVEASVQKDKEGSKASRSSPKRKSSDRAEDVDIPGSVGGEVASCDGKSKGQCIQDSEPGSPPLDPRELKRTRLGSVRKKMIWEKGEDENSTSPDVLMKEKPLHVQETPKQKPPPAEALTPVSARCIEIKKINL